MELDGAEPGVVWREFVERHGDELPPGARAVLVHLTLTEISSARAVVSCPARHASIARTKLRPIGLLLGEHTGRKLELSLVESDHSEEAEGQTQDAQEAHARETEAPGEPGVGLKEVEGDPLVKKTMELFEAEVVHVSARKKE